MVFPLVRSLFCEDNTNVLETNWTSSGKVPNISECAQHVDFSILPTLFLFLFSPLILYDLHKSQNPKLKSSSPIFLRIIICSLLVLDLTISFFYNVYLFVSDSLTTANPFLLGDCFQYIGFCVALVLTIACRNRGVVTSGVIFIFWLLTVLCGFPEARYITEDLYYRTGKVDELRGCLFLVSYFFSCLELFLSSFADTPTTGFHGNKQCPEHSSSFLNQITFQWFTNLAILGNRKSLEKEDLWELNDGDKTTNLMPDFLENLQPELKAHKKLQKEDPKEAENAKNHPSILKPIFETYKWTFISGAAYKLFFDLLQFVAPELLKQLISFIQDKNQPLWIGVAIASLMFLSALLQSMLLHQYFHNMFRLGMNIRAVLTSAVYRKALNLSNEARKNMTTGAIVNLMSVDIQRIQDMTTFVMLFWSSPLQILLSIFFLWKLLGVSVIAGLLILLLLIPFNSWISIKMRTCQMEQMKYKDERIKMMSEILNGMKVLKLYAWEKSMEKLILEIREKELRVLRRLAFLNAATTLSWACAPFLVAVLTFGLYVVIDPENNILTPQITFVALALFNILRFPLAVFAMVFSQAVQCVASNDRLKAFFAAEEMPSGRAVGYSGQETTVKVKGGNWSWNNSAADTVLHDIDLEVKKGELVAIVGKVGSGKSSLVQALLGEMTKISGHAEVNGSVAYVPQQAWIQNMSLRDNILFNRFFDPEFYEKVVEASALKQDLASLPTADFTEIGEKGINLSGGQKQRVSLARAIYSNADIVFLDDPLSAVDAHVGKHIFENVISSDTGLLSTKTRILVTHGLTNLRYCNKVVVMKDGQISECGTYDELLESNGAFSEFLEEFVKEESKHIGRSVSFGEDRTSVDEILKDLSQEKRQKLQSQLSQASKTSEEHPPPSNESAEATQKEQPPTKDEEKQALLPVENGKPSDTVAPTNKSKLIEKENIETGKVKLTVYTTYFKAIGIQISLIFILVYVASSVLGVYSNLYLAKWSDDAVEIAKANNGTAGETYERLGFYTLLGLGQAASVCAASVIMALGMVNASKLLHSNLLNNIMHSPMAFFDVTPIGRILNRFGKDIEAVDQTLPQTIRSMMMTLFNVVSTIFVILFATPLAGIAFLFLSVIYFIVLDIDGLDAKIPVLVMNVVSCLVNGMAVISVCVMATPMVIIPQAFTFLIYRYIWDIDGLDNHIPRSVVQFSRTLIATLEIILVIVWTTPLSIAIIVPLFFLYLAILRFYVSTSRQLKRLESASRSPIYSHFQESIQGASSIRAYGALDNFVKESQNRVDSNLATYYPSIVANRWLAVRLELVGNLIVLSAALFAVLFRGTPGLSAGLVGLSVSYALNITQTLNWAVRMTSELETNIVAVERIKEYTVTPTEGAKGTGKAPVNWPQEGKISIMNYSTRYRPGLDLVLHDVTAHINSGEKVGIVGRTGAGKSSLTLALFRIIEADGGFIEIDGTNISDLQLEELRSRLTIVPQDPVLFSGTLRLNLDPFETFTDDQVWTALDNAHLESFVRSLPDALTHKISEGGENLSVGQRQLICLARALLRKTKVLILDEAAAAVDMETDSLLQKTIKEQFKDCTVLTIAHRLNTVMDSDRILVLDKGSVAEFDSPKKLMSNTDGILYSMAKDARLV